MNDRFVDDGLSLHELVLEPVDVRCPKCDAHARLVPLGGCEVELHMARRLSCFECGFTKDHNGRTLGFARMGEDPCFSYALWYRTETAKGRIWAYHRSPLEEMRAYIAASNRRRLHRTSANQAEDARERRSG